MRTLFCFDWDGTIYSYSKKLNETIPILFKKLHKLDYPIAIVSGRNSLSTMIEYQNIRKYISYTVLANGAIIKKGNKKIKTNYIPKKRVVDLISYCKAKKIDYGFDKASSKYISNIDKETYSEMYESDLIVIQKQIPLDNVISFWFKTFDQNIMNDIIKEFADLNVFKWRSGGASIQSNSDKSQGVKELLEILNVKEFVAFGDGPNDYPMLDTAKKGYIASSSSEKNSPYPLGPDADNGDFVQFFNENNLTEEKL